QAEDGIRDGHVTGVQTCALPIYKQAHRRRYLATPRLPYKRCNPVLKTVLVPRLIESPVLPDQLTFSVLHNQQRAVYDGRFAHIRSEERRVGKECRSCRWR